jgi:hypothetical protein
MLVQGKPPFQRFLLNQVGKIVRPNKGGGYVDGSVASGKVTQAGQVSAEEPDKMCPTAGR